MRITLPSLQMRELGLRNGKGLALGHSQQAQEIFQHWEMGSPRLGMKVMALESHWTGLVRNKLGGRQAVREHPSERQSKNS